MESRTGGFSGVKDKIDLSLDDIIRLNKKQRQTSKKGIINRKVPSKGRLPQGKRPGPSPSTPGGTTQRGDMSRFGTRGHKGPPAVKRRRAQGVITGLAARRSTTVFRGIAPLNRPIVDQKTKPFVHEMQRRRTNPQRRPYRQTEAPKPSHTLPRRPIQLRRTAPPAHQVQREARQATFFSRRGLKVQAAVPKTTAAPVVHQMSQRWRTPSTVNGILTVCIDNPSARTQPEPARAWSLHPQSTPAVEVKEEKKPEKKPPKGVPLQFDINSVGKQTTVTLNERFRILKDRRTAAAKSTKASRFVTVG